MRIKEDIFEVCSKGGSIPKLKELLSLNTDPNQTRVVNEREGEITPLHVCLSNPDKVRILLEHGADPNFCAENTGQPPLHKACQDGSWASCLYLLEAGANVHATDNSGYSALDYAIICSEMAWHEKIAEKTIRTLLEFGADPNKPSQGTSTRGLLPLNRAASNKVGYGICKTLLHHGANPTLKDQRGLNAINYATKETKETILDGIAKWKSKEVMQKISESHKESLEII